jgi:hypothetical protein
VTHGSPSSRMVTVVKSDVVALVDSISLITLRNTVLCRCGHFPADHEMKTSKIIDSQGRVVVDVLGSEPVKEVR